MGAKDTKAKEYFSDNRHFADLCNAVLFDGEQVITPEMLEEQDTTEFVSLGTAAGEMQIQRWRDLLKRAIVKSVGSVYIVLFGAEAQAYIHYAAPVKIMNYDAINYSRQVTEAGKRHLEAGDCMSGSERLSGFCKGDTLTPVITLTVYLGTETWDAPRRLSEMYADVDARLLPFLPEYDAHVVIPAEIEDFSKFATPLGALLELLKYAENKGQMRELLHSDPKYKNLDNETVRAINVFAGTRIPVSEGKGTTDMCKAWDDQYKDGVQQGIQEATLASICNMIEFGIPKETILTKYTESEYDKACALR